ncbi:MAG: hypothetical protein U9P07_06845 [Pseudomonadota bacterium]|nr:hypothetical protein [Pseudomonadota bacterium]
MFRHGSRSFSPAVHGLPVRAARRQAGLWGALKQYPRVRRESHRVIRSAANNRYEPSPNILLICPWQCKSES